MRAALSRAHRDEGGGSTREGACGGRRARRRVRTVRVRRRCIGMRSRNSGVHAPDPAEMWPVRRSAGSLSRSLPLRYGSCHKRHFHFRLSASRDLQGRTEGACGPDCPARYTQTACRPGWVRSWSGAIDDSSGVLSAIGCIDIATDVSCSGPCAANGQSGATAPSPPSHGRAPVVSPRHQNPAQNDACRRESSPWERFECACGGPISIVREHAAGRSREGNGGMFEKRLCVLRRGCGAGMEGTGTAAERATVTQSAPSQSRTASGAAGAQRRRTKRGARGPTPARRKALPAWSGVSVSGVTRAVSPTPSPPLGSHRLRRARQHEEPTRAADAARSLWG